jgi:limonene-1,2-epoxide hydrolase
VTHEEQAAFVERFAAAWAAPDGGARLMDLLHPDVRLVQPLEPEVRGHEQARALWDRLFAQIPDLRGEVLRWAGSQDLLLIEARLYGTLAERPIEWVTADHIRLEDGLVRERIARFDPLPIVAAGLGNPRAWPGLARVGLARLRD